MMPLCVDQGIGVIPWSPLARGLLAGKRSRGGRGDSAGPSAGPDAPALRGETDTLTDELYDHESDWDVVDATLRVARRRGAEPVGVALAWLLSRPAVAAPVVGFTRVEQMDAAAAAVDLVLTAEECAELEAPYRPHDVRGWLGGPLRLPGISS